MSKIEALPQNELHEHEAARAALVEAQDGWKRRLDAIQSDRRRKSGPLEADFAEQAVQRENDDTLDALDARGRQELEAIEAALQRLDAGTFGLCTKCGEAIAKPRLRAQPTALTCIGCAEQRSGG